jgi:CHAD domain-containing protein
VRAYETLLGDAPLGTYHRLRIGCKGLRYALEFFKEVLGPEAPGLIKQVVAMQDLLGDLQDSSVAEEMVTQFLHDESLRQREEVRSEGLDGVAAYLTHLWQMQRELLARFPDRWAGLIGYDFRRNLSLAIAAL